MRRLRVDRRVGLLLGGVLLASFAALGASVALPASDPELAGREERLSRLERQGMEVYRNEGCWYCHTQYVRESSVDADLGTPMDAKAYAGESPAMLGTERIGPDLTHYGSSGVGPSTVVDFLSDPGEDSSYRHRFGYLSDADLRALAAYLLSLK
jgi:cbb3-type cytochrome oxidase cytochrome c subunit